MSDPDHARLMEAVARHFFGEPNRRLSKKGELRFGTHGSLSIDLGKATWYDHEANKGGGPLDLIKRETGISELRDCYAWAESEGYWRNVHAGGPQPKPRGEPTATYDYADEGGELLFQVCRYAGHDFKQRRSDGRGGWIYCVKGVRLVPYRLPELVEAIGGGSRVLIAEGEKDVDNLIKIGVPATCNPMGAGKWPKMAAQLNPHFTGADVIICCDNDEPGRKHANDVATSLTGIASLIRMLDIAKVWPACPPKGDISNWIEAGGTIEQLDALIEQAPDYAPQPQDDGGRFKLKRFDEISLTTKPNYLIKGLLPRSGLAVIWGPPKCGKSFVAFDMAMHIALKREYRGRRVQQGSIVYCALEGGGGFAARVEAWRKRKLNGERDIPFYLLDVSLDLISDHAELVACIRAQVAELRAVFVDTLNRALTGDENSSADMGKLVRAAGAISTAFGCLVVLIHHCGLAGNRPRGHSRLSGADDAQISVVKDKDGLITVTIDHMKDSAAGAPFACKLEVVELGNDDEGDPMTSLIVVATEAAETGPKLTKVQKFAFDLLPKLIAREAVEPPADANLAGFRGCLADSWRKEFYATYPADKQASKKKALFRATLDVEEKGLIVLWREFIWVGDKGDK